ncbi:MAG: efflux RND transporter permease subunit, partial [Planctomycetota bacterium]
MQALAAFGVRRPVVANLLMYAILAAGLIFGLGLTKEFLPEVRPNQVIVTAPFPGQSPEEIEEALAIRIEDRLADLTDVVEIASTVTEGAATIRVEYRDGVPIEAAVAEVKREVDALQDLPEEADRIVVEKLEPNLPAVVLSLYGDGDQREMKEAIREIRDDLRSLPGMGDVVADGVVTDEISVEVRPSALLRHNLSLAEVAGRVNEAMRELPAGSVR